MSLALIEFYKQIPAILVILPLFLSLVIVIVGNKTFARVVFVITNIMLFITSLIGFYQLEYTRYNFGDWPSPVGIEFKIDVISIFTVSLLYFISSIFSIALFRIFSQKLESIILPGRKHIVYSLFLLVEAGYAGIILTNDIFNFYVFLEIASLASYPLITISSDKRALIAAFEYLVIGTIAATVILISIGIIFALCGSLNLPDIQLFLKSNSINIKFAVLFLIVGALVKVAIFPFHGWKLKSYSSTSNVIACFFISISTIVAVMILFKFRFLSVYLSSNVKNYLQFLGFISIIFGAIAAYSEDDYRKIVIYSSISSAGYYLILWPYDQEKTLYLFLQFLFFDSFVKFGLLVFLSAIGKDNISVRQLIGFSKSHQFFAVIFLILLINAAALPPSIGFFNKLSLISYYSAEHILYVIILSISSLFLTLSYLRIARQLVKNSDIQNSFKLDALALSCVLFIVGILIYFITSTQNLQSLTELILKGL